MIEKKAVERAAARIQELEAELESTGDATILEADLAAARAVLHGWVDSVVGLVSSPGVGRVTLIHANGRESKIASPDLPYLLAKPISFGGSF